MYTWKVEAHAKWIDCRLDGRTAWSASVGDDMVCRLWDAETGAKPPAELAGMFVTPHNFLDATPRLSPDGRYVATGDKVGHVVIWEVATGRRPPPGGPRPAAPGTEASAATRSAAILAAIFLARRHPARRRRYCWSATSTTSTARPASRVFDCGRRSEPTGLWRYAEGPGWCCPSSRTATQPSWSRANDGFLSCSTRRPRCSPRRRSSPSSTTSPSESDKPDPAFGGEQVAGPPNWKDKPWPDSTIFCWPAFPLRPTRRCLAWNAIRGRPNDAMLPPPASSVVSMLGSGLTSRYLLMRSALLSAVANLVASNTPSSTGSLFSPPCRTPRRKKNVFILIRLRNG